MKVRHNVKCSKKDNGLSKFKTKSELKSRHTELKVSLKISQKNIQKSAVEILK